jgi:hypothetical protein
VTAADGVAEEVRLFIGVGRVREWCVRSILYVGQCMDGTIMGVAR